MHPFKHVALLLIWLTNRPSLSAAGVYAPSYVILTMRDFALSHPLDTHLRSV